MRLFSKFCPYTKPVQGKETVHARFFVHQGILVMEPFIFFCMNLLKNLQGGNPFIFTKYSTWEFIFPLLKFYVSPPIRYLALQLNLKGGYGILSEHHVIAPEVHLIVLRFCQRFYAFLPVFNLHLF
jgi:predicted permease